MKINGTQYYWMIAGGLLLAYPVSILIQILGEAKIDSNPWLQVLFVALFIYPSICYFVVLIEIWSLIKYKLILVVGGVFLAAWLIHPVLLGIYSIGPTIYWFWRIKGIPNKQ